MRTYTAKIGDKNYELAINFKAMQLIATRVMDPVAIARDLANQEQAATAGRPYAPQFDFTTTNVLAIFQAGLEANGNDITLDELGEELMENKHGFVPVIEAMAQYLLKLVGGDVESKELSTGKKGGSRGKK